MLTYLTAGESHGKALMGIIQGLPSNMKIDLLSVNSALENRQQGYGRGGRMAIETDTAEFIAGIRGGFTTGAPIGFLVHNKDHTNWQEIIGATATKLDQKNLTAVRPGHADLAGCIKYDHKDARNILERASARNTATQVVLGNLCKQYLDCLGVKVSSSVVSIGGETLDKKIKSKIDDARKDGDTLGGIVSIKARGLPAGFGSHISPTTRLEFTLTSHLSAIQSVKSVSVGNAAGYAGGLGSKMHDACYIDNSKKVIRKTNNAGGIEGGISNGEDIVLQLVCKPIPTVMKGLDTVDIAAKKATKSATERSDVCAVEAVAVVAESVFAYALASVVVSTLGGDTLAEALERMDKKRSKANDILK